MAEKICAECGKTIEPYTEFPSADGKGVVCLPCYERRMEGVEFTAQDVVSAFVASVNV
jgi:hypothetical protein